MTNWSVVLASDAPPSVKTLSAALQDVLGWVKYEAAKAARSCGPSAILVEGIERSAAREIVGRLRESAIDSMAVGGQLPDPVPEESRGVDYDDHELRLLDGNGVVEGELAWGDLRVIVAGRVTPPEVSKSYFHDGGYSGKRRSSPLDILTAKGRQGSTDVEWTTERTTGPADPELWLASSSPPALWRLRARGMSYRFLGDRMESSAARNLAVLVGDLLAHALGALAPEATLRFGSGERDLPETFESEASLQAYCRALLVRSLAGHR